MKLKDLLKDKDEFESVDLDTLKQTSDFEKHFKDLLAKARLKETSLQITPIKDKDFTSGIRSMGDKLLLYYNGHGDSPNSTGLVMKKITENYFTSYISMRNIYAK